MLFSAVTVAAALAGLMVFPQRFLFSMGVAGVMVALIAAAIALLVLPAVLALLGTPHQQRSRRSPGAAAASTPTSSSRRASGTGSPTRSCAARRSIADRHRGRR